MIVVRVAELVAYSALFALALGVGIITLYNRRP